MGATISGESLEQAIKDGIKHHCSGWNGELVGYSLGVLLILSVTMAGHNQPKHTLWPGTMAQHG
jgi:hypothetical protein